MGKFQRHKPKLAAAIAAATQARGAPAPAAPQQAPRPAAVPHVLAATDNAVAGDGADLPRDATEDQDQEAPPTAAAPPPVTSLGNNNSSNARSRRGAEGDDEEEWVGDDAGFFADVGAGSGPSKRRQLRVSAEAEARGARLAKLGAVSFRDEGEAMPEGTDHRERAKSRIVALVARHAGRKGPLSGGGGGKKKAPQGR